MPDVMTDFDPKKHGFHFSNNFVNTVCNTPFGKITSRGRCGGMAFAALDYYYAKLPIPTHRGRDFPGGEVPPDGTCLADYIYHRLMDSFALNAGKFIFWSQIPPWPFSDNLPEHTKRHEFPALVQRLSGGPVVIGLIKSKNLWEITSNHQVVAYGAKLDDDSGVMTVYIYDNNAADRAVTLISTPSNSHFTSSLSDCNGNHYRYRGWFVEAYSPERPTYVDE